MFGHETMKRFSTTRWSLIVAAAGGSSESDQALAELCERYWYPVYAFIRRSGHSTDEAADLAQGFFVRIIERQYLRDADPQRGRFRSFLIAALRHYLSNVRNAERTWKRGGRHIHLPLELSTAERTYSLEPVDDITPEVLYERQWALTVLDQAMERLEARYAETAGAHLFHRLKSMLTSPARTSYAVLATELGMSEGALRVAVHRLRKEFGASLRATIAETLQHPTDVDDELRHLLSVVSGA